MESRCYGCAAKFTLFKKECGCKNCGRSFCSGCLSFSAAVPRAGNAQHKVCKPCHELLTRGPSVASAARWSPPENYKRRVAELEARRGPAASRPAAQLSADQVIAQRLERLRQESRPKPVPSPAEIEARLAALQAPRGPVLSIREMEERLAALQGHPPPTEAPRPAHQPPDPRTQAQQAEDLLAQLAAEVAIDEIHERVTPPAAASPQNDLNRGSPGSRSGGPEGPGPRQLEEEKGRLLAEAAAELREENTRQERVLALAKRLAVLRGLDPDRVTLQDYHLPDSDEDVEEEEAIRRVLQQLTEEAALDEASGFNIPAGQPPPSQPRPHRPEVQSPTPMPAVPTLPATPTEEELPWCCICNEDATLRCHGCAGDLYCSRCFREGHDAFERKEHRTTAFRAPREGQDD
ncbi:abscission/NoCut checkpoint regulator isoform X2 [Ornithorhynchus anatinus]|uniref:abscission/NoCut checkpoint regulator isoform X2 n=1 Tax=Ornithorhynchus anatinus TaxID=9258 RepID=UPI0010A8705A|nr:abscission/NoCut checkpoint regulator isoform X2 [Ornithorhynchus anatinus]